MRSTPTRLPDRVKAALWASSLAGLAAGAMMAAVSLSSSALAENIHGAATGPTTAPGFSHPEQYIHLKDVKPADNMYPVIQHPRAGQGGARVQMDYVLGKLVDKLAEIGELDNTLIIFTSDNGPECEIPPHGWTPFRGCKGSRASLTGCSISPTSYRRKANQRRAAGNHCGWSGAKRSLRLDFQYPKLALIAARSEPRAPSRVGSWCASSDS
jgi:hypothetical protein